MNFDTLHKTICCIVALYILFRIPSRTPAEPLTALRFETILIGIALTNLFIAVVSEDIQARIEVFRTINRYLNLFPSLNKK